MKKTFRRKRRASKPKQTKREFKVGDRVKILGNDNLGIGNEKEGYVVDLNEAGNIERVEIKTGWPRDNSISSAYKSKGGNSFWNVFGEKFELVSSAKKSKPRKINFILQYVLREDPIEEFETLPEVRKRIKELLENKDLQRDSLVVYEIKAKRSVTIKNQVIIK